MELTPELRLRLAELCQEGWEESDRFTRTRAPDEFHPFVAADYESVLNALEPLRAPGRRFLEWGSANGVITIMADLLGFEAFGIELDERLVEISRKLARRFDSGAVFTHGSFLPQGYRFLGATGDNRMGTIGAGPSGYLELGRHLDEFDVVFAFPWGGEEPMMLDLMSAFGSRSATFLLNTVNDGVRTYRAGLEV